MAEFILKDWYGKDCRFDHDKIFVQDANGNLVQFTQGKGNPVLEELRVAENGLYTPKGTVDGFNRVVVDVASEINEMLFNKTNFSGFASGDEFNGLHTKTLIVGTDIDSLKIIDGREYTVYWDDVNYTTYAKDTNYIIEEAVGGETIYRSIYYLGNGTLLGLNGAEDTGEPFALQYTQSKELLLVSTDTAETHSVAIMKRVRPRDGLEMMLQSLTVTENGTYTADSYYDGLKTVNVDVPIPEVVLQDKTITENGTFTADDGFDGLGSVTVDVKGSGGESLPAGLYWQPLEIKPPSNYRQTWFELNGELYAVTNSTSGNAPIGYIYKWNGTSWVAIVSGLNWTFAGAISVNIVEYNGKIHFSGGESTKHYIFDGTTTTTASELPNKVYGNGMFVQNGLLKIYSYYDGCVYVWDETSDTWTAESTIGSKYKYIHFLYDDNNVYAIYSTTVYSYDGSALTQIGTLTKSPSDIYLVGNKIYFLLSSSGCLPQTLYTYDCNTNIQQKIGLTPSWSNYNTFFEYNGLLYYLAYYDSGYFVPVTPYEVTE